MLTHYFLVAYRALARNRFDTVVSVIGLALGFLSFVGAYAFAAYVDSADRQHANAVRTFVMFQKTTIESMGLALPFLSDTSPLLAERLQGEFPQVADAGRARELANAIVTTGAVKSFQYLWRVDAGFMRIFAPPVTGTKNADISSIPSGLLLTNETALELFGRTDVVGETVNVANTGDLEVVGILGALASPSHITGAPFNEPPAGFIVTRDDDPLWIPRDDDPWRWLGGARTYLLLKQGAASAEEINRQLPDFVERNVRTSLAGLDVEFQLREVSALVREHVDEALWGAFGMSFTNLLTLIGSVVLGIACINFTSLSITRAAKRAKEIGLRKAIGATRTQVIAQYLMETTLTVGIAIAIAVGLLELGVATVNDTLGLSIHAPTASDHGFWAATLAIVLLVIVTSGGYSALILSRTPPLDAMRKSGFGSGAGTLRASLSTVQFAAASFLIVAVAIIAAQNAVLRQAGLALGSDPLVVIPIALRDTGVDPELFRTRLLESPAILDVTGANISPWEGLISGTGYSRTPDDASSFGFLQAQSVWYRYFETIGTTLLAGRTFSQDHSDVPTGDEARSQRVIIDRLAAEQFGWSNPADAIGQVIYESSLPAPKAKTIVGVVEHAPARIVGGQMSSAFVYALDFRNVAQPLIKVASSAVPAALAHIDAVWRSVAPDIPIKREFVDERFARAYVLFEHISRAFSFLATLAIAISVFGLFGMAAHIVGKRQREIGIRKVQGATPRGLFAMLLRQFLYPVLIGNAIALPLALIAGRAYLHLFVQPVPLSPGPFVVGVAVTVLAATSVIAYHIVRAVCVTPATLLRHE